MSDDRTQEQDPSPNDGGEDQDQERSSSPNNEDSQKGSGGEERVKEMEQRIERVDEHIDDARDKAEEAGTHDPQPMTGGGSEQDETR
jgi:hypothetical protein